jgi:hypothetical protein
MKTTPLESAIGLKRTKGGGDDKQLAYLTSRENAKRFGVILIGVAFFVIIWGLLMKQELGFNSYNASALRKQAIREKQALFRSRMEVANSNKAAESKLVKILSVLQDHLSRDTEDKDALLDFQMAFGNQVKKHKRLLKRELKLLDGNQKVSKYLTHELDEAVNDFYWIVTEEVKSCGEGLLQEGKDADARVQLLTQGVLDELEAESKEEAREERDEERIEMKDPQWKNFAAQFKKHSKFARVESQDQKDVEEMLSQFKQNIADMPEPPYLSPADLEEAQKLRKVLDRQFDGAKSMGGRKGELNVQRPRNEEAIREKMITMMKKAKFIPTGQTAASPDYGTDTMLLFDEFVDMAMGRNALPELEGELKDWEKDKISDNVMMLQVEKAVENGEVNPIMLHEGETSKEQAEMLEMGTTDHEEDPKAEPPKPIESEEAVAAVACDISCSDGCKAVADHGLVPSEECKVCMCRPSLVSLYVASCHPVSYSRSCCHLVAALTLCTVYPWVYSFIGVATNRNRNSE